MKNLTLRSGIAAFMPALILLALFSLNSYAQVNTEKYRVSGKSDGLGGNLDLSVAWYKGNTDLIAVDTELGLYYNKKKNQFFLRGILKYGEKNGESYIDMAFLHLRGIRKFSERVMAEYYVQKEFNKFILLKSRNLAGAGVRFAVCKSETGEGEKKKLFVCYLSTGLFWEDESYSQAEDSSQKEAASLLKSSNYLSLSYQTGAAELGITSYFQFHIEKFASFRNFSDLFIKVKLGSHLNFLSKINFRFDNRPPETVKKYDFQITNGLSLEF
jgi:hypothetical protein